MQYGYVVRDNDLGMQQKALDAYGCNFVIDNKEIDRVIEKLVPGDVLVVWRLDKLGKDIPTLRKVIDDVHQAGASVRSISDKFNSAMANKGLLDKIMDTISSAE
ncbi:hypothetical protein FMH15_16965 [Vibrio alginolyticus]|nr:hypothetical protein [Vibrio alginolyticus]